MVCFCLEENWITLPRYRYLLYRTVPVQVVSVKSWKPLLHVISVVAPDRVGSASFCRIRIGIQRMPILIWPIGMGRVSLSSKQMKKKSCLNADPLEKSVTATLPPSQSLLSLKR